MSTLTYGIGVTPHKPSDGLRMDAFVIPFSRNNGVLFSLIIAPRDEFAAILGTVRNACVQFAEKTPDESLIEARFEQVMSSINTELGERFRHNDTFDPQTIQGVVGVTTEELLVLAGRGALAATFLRSDAPGTYHVFDLLKNLQTDGIDSLEEREGGKLFGALVSGEVRPGDLLGITSREAITHIGDGEWKRILATMEPGEASAHVRRVLGMKSAPGIALVLRLGTPRTVPQGVGSTPSASIEALRSTERTTEKLLGGSVGIGIIPLLRRVVTLIGGTTKRGLAALVSGIKKLGARAHQNMHGAARPRERRSFTARVGGALSAMWFVVVGIFGAIAHLIRGLIPGNRGRETRRRSFADFAEALHRINDFVVTRFNALPRLSKLLFITVLVFIVLFVQSILYLGYRRGVQSKQATYLAAIAAIERLRTDAEASLIYRDEEQARTLLEEARAQVAALPHDSRSKRRAAERLSASLEEALVKLRHEIVITNEMLTSLATPRPIDAFDYRLTLYETVNATSPTIATSTYEGRTVALREDGALEAIEADGSRAPYAPNLPGSAVDAELFGTRLYLLAPAVPQIYRANRTGATFGIPAPWLREAGEEIQDARDLGIDGAMYVLKPNGIIKFFSGVKETWSPYIDPALENATRIWTSDEVDGIYVLEPNRRRIIVLDKPGGLLAQYIFPEGSNLRDFAVDEKNKKLAVLDGDRIEETALTHLVTQ